MSLHADAADVLTRWSAPDDEQDRLRRRFLAHLEARGDAMRRTCHPDHLTASVLIVSADGASALLTLHRKLQRWLQTGGHCEDTDATLVDAAVREGVEESGIDDLGIDSNPILLSRHEVPCGPERPAHHLDVQHLAIAPRDAQPRISEESSALRWFPVDDLPESADDSVRALVRAARRRQAASPNLRTGSHSVSESRPETSSASPPASSTQSSPAADATPSR